MSSIRIDIETDSPACRAADGTLDLDAVLTALAGVRRQLDHFDPTVPAPPYELTVPITGPAGRCGTLEIIEDGPRVPDNVTVVDGGGGRYEIPGS